MNGPSAQFFRPLVSALAIGSWAATLIASLASWSEPALAQVTVLDERRVAEIIDQLEEVDFEGLSPIDPMRPPGRKPRRGECGSTSMSRPDS